ncbi:MAG: hypothetical protein UY81_C0004G0002 [Candidatus Giovannonibacteria bacterium GW2011_GWA2_53_7]|uniref:Uncharacterized protein n=1 Tax=Candidatus Giovannonibacteria bacterium GW2011_GWA2_53_7 TaxID=1618650 RepID=A0A0G1Y0V6_9BACT|nr:MAG: hypothetical protein UY81_C0004G0002 [Candidatus Giovannonibacteria bacterium GW2011_GWA2_53_7]
MKIVLIKDDGTIIATLQGKALDYIKRAILVYLQDNRANISSSTIASEIRDFMGRI